MNKSELINRLAADTSFHPSMVQSVLTSLAHQVSKELGDGESVQLPGIGTLKTSERAARRGVHPRTGKPIDIPAKTGVTFTATKALKEHVA